MIVRLFIALACLVAPLLVLAASGPAPDSMLAGMHWRLVGPHRAGWATIGSGVPGQPDTFYFGAAGGGVWKTEDAGRTWASLFDDEPASSIGALAVAPSAPQTIYVGTGQVAARYDVAAGNGVYKSTDGGRTWQSLGLAQTRHIGAILIDPSNVDTVLVAALGHYFGPNPERGVFRSSDGGRTWQQTLRIDVDTGTVDLARAPDDTGTIYAAAWQVRNYPWLSYFQPNQGPGSGVYKSTDDGVTWRRLRGGGWPDATLGRIGLAATTGGRVYAVVDAAPNSGNVPHANSQNAGGLYRSDDGGSHWARVSSESWLENDYFSRVTVDPTDRDRLYAMGQSIRRSDDGGKTWTVFRGSPGGDDYHHLWINPERPDHMIASSDQGAAVSVDSGRTWSSWYNQPTGQLYHLAADTRFPYWIYAGQQDNGTVAIASRSDYGAISFRDWHPVGADERDDEIPDPADPNIVYGSGLGGRLSRWNAVTGEVQNVSPWPVVTYGARPNTVKYRYTWITPIAVSQVKPYPLYQGAQVLFRSLDRGASWKAISPDLSAAKKNAKHCDAGVSAKLALDCGFGVIYTIAPSPRSNDILWVGTDDGKVRMTRDGGATWNDVTPQGVPAWAKISTVDASALDDASAYVAVDTHRQNRFAPQLYRTHDFGAHWTRIDNGLPGNQFTSVMRTDTTTRGLLFAGTDQGVYVSFDDGDDWQPLQRNLPTAWVRDLLVHDDDLIVATQGRAIWVLDDLAPLRQMSQAHAQAGAFLFKPADSYRLRRSENRDTPLPPETPLGENPPAGAIIDYVLPSAAQTPVVLEIRDSAGNLVRRFASDAKAPWRNADRYFGKDWTRPQKHPGTEAGAHRFVWDLNYPRPRVISYQYSIAAIHGDDTLLMPLGPTVAPGTYDIALSVDGKTLHAPLTVRMDPRVDVDAGAVERAATFGLEIDAALGRAYQGYGELKSVRDQLDALRKPTDASPSAELNASIDALMKATTSLVEGDGQHTTSVPAISAVLASLATDVETTDRAPTAPQRAVYADYTAKLAQSLDRWHALRDGDLATLNTKLTAAGKPAIKVPTLAQIHFEGSGVARDLP
ncbi:MAG: hypothetical protein WB784_11575 [Rhodanobacteraceae bacterium]